MGFVSKAIGGILGSGDQTQAEMIGQDQNKLRSRVDYSANSGIQLQDALQQQALNGSGPLNTVFNNALGQGIREAGSTISSAKGINTGLAARLAGEQAGQMAQNAVGQRAQNQLAAQGLASQNNLGLGQQAIGNISQQNSANAGIAQGNNASTSNGVGGLLNGLGGMAAKAGMAYMTGGASLAAGGMPGSSSGDYKNLPSGGGYAHGGLIPGKAEVPGDSPVNDTQPAMLSPGEVVVPREVVSGGPEKIKEFVEALTSQKKAKQPKGFAKVLDAHRKLGELLKSSSGDE